MPSLSDLNVEEKVGPTVGGKDNVVGQHHSPRSHRPRWQPERRRCLSQRAPTRNVRRSDGEERVRGQSRAVRTLKPDAKPTHVCRVSSRARPCAVHFVLRALVSE